MKYCTLLLVLAAIAGSGTLCAQVPQIINYQGRVVVGTTNFNGTGQFKFALVNATGTTTYWSNDGTSNAGSQPTNAVSLGVANGLYSVLLGDTSISNMTVAIPASVFNNSDVRLRVWFSDGSHGSQLLTPDQRIASVGYAAMAANIVDGAITSAKIANGAVGSPQIANSSVGSSQIASNAVGSSQIASGAVGSAQIASNAVGSTQIAAGAVGTAQIANGAVTSAKIDSTTVQQRVTGTAPAGSFITGINQNGTVTSAVSGSSIWSLNGTTAYYTGGNVGIGQTSATYKLEITDATSGFDLALSGPSPILKFTDTSASNAVTSLRAFAGGLRIANATSTLADFESSGNVGLGTSSPGYRLHLYDPSNSITEMIETAGGTNSWSRLAFKTNDHIWTVGTSQNYNADELYFFLGNGSAGIQLQLLTTGQLIATTPTGFSGFTHTDGAISVGSYVGGSNSGAFGGWLGTFSNHPLYFFVNNGQPSLTIGTDGTTTVKVLTITGGSDLAEPFPMNEEQIEKGAVVVIDAAHPGRLKRSSKAYDRKVAGIVSGANGINPGIALHQDGAMEGGENVALSGRVYVQADTSNGAIEPGDLLTTSDVAGYAMKVTDHARAQGAVIGKAMSSLRAKQGTVLVLVTLQ